MHSGRSLKCEVNRLKYSAAPVIVQLMDEACVPNHKSDLRYCNGTFVAIISHQGGLKSISWLITPSVIGASTAWITVSTFCVSFFFFQIKTKTWLVQPHSQRHYFSVLVSRNLLFIWGGGSVQLIYLTHSCCRLVCPTTLRVSRREIGVSQSRYLHTTTLTFKNHASYI
jgi:hypothetical protein